MMGFPRGNGLVPSNAVVTDTTLTGDGSSASPLSVVQSYVTLATQQTVTGLKTFSIEDGARDTVLDAVVLRRTTSHASHGDAGIGAGFLFESEDAGGNVEAVARIAGVLTNAGNSTEASALDFEMRTGGGALTRRIRMWGGGGMSIGNTVNPGSNSIVIPDSGNYYGLFGSDLKPIAGINGNVITFGNLSSSWHAISPTGYEFRKENSARYLHVKPNEIIYGTGDNDPGSDVDYLIRGEALSGTNIAGKKLTIRGRIGTGTGTVGRLSFEVGQAAASGTTAHTVVEGLAIIDSDTDDDTAMLVRVRRGGVESVDRVTIGAADSAGSGFRSLRVPN